MLRATLVLLLTVAAPAAEPMADGGWVAVGYGGRRMISTEGRAWDITAEWSQPGGDDKHNLMSLVYVPNPDAPGGRFIAAGGGGGGAPDGGHVLVSEDGRTWRETFTARNRINPLLSVPHAGPGRLVAGGPNRRLLVSEDLGETWRDGPQIDDPRATHFRHGVVGNGLCLLIGNHGGGSVPYWAAVTREGTAIDGLTADLPAVRGLAFGGGRFVIVGPGGVRRTSADGLRWDSHRAIAKFGLGSAVKWGGS